MDCTMGTKLQRHRAYPPSSSARVLLSHSSLLSQVHSIFISHGHVRNNTHSPSLSHVHSSLENVAAHTLSSRGCAEAQKTTCPPSPLSPPQNHLSVTLTSHHPLTHSARPHSERPA